MDASISDEERLQGIKQRLESGFINPIWKEDVEWLIARFEHFEQLLEMVEWADRVRR